MTKSPSKTAAKAPNKVAGKGNVKSWPDLDKQSLDMKGVVDEIQADHPEFSKTDIEGVVRTFTHLLVDRVAKHGFQRIAGFGAFSVKESPARVGRNPQTGAAVEIPPRRSVKFTASNQLKVAVNAPAN